jgi:adenylosuccinate lyase
MELVKAGADRQVMHEVIRNHSMLAWREVTSGQANPLRDRLSTNPDVTSFLPPDRVRFLLDASGYVGDAPERARQMAEEIRQAVAQPGP